MPVYFWYFSLFFTFPTYFLIVMEKDVKAPKKMASTSEWLESTPWLVQIQNKSKENLKTLLHKTFVCSLKVLL